MSEQGEDEQGRSPEPGASCPDRNAQHRGPGATSDRLREGRTTLRPRATGVRLRWPRGSDSTPCASSGCRSARILRNAAGHRSAPPDRGRSRRLARLPPLDQLLDEGEHRGDEEDPDQGRHQHPADHHGAELAPGDRAAARREPERDTAEDERERGHQDRPEPELGAPDRRVVNRPALPPLAARELDDQDRVLRGEPDQHHHPDLAEHVGRVPAQEQPEERADDRDRGGEEHAPRQRPALVEGREHEEDHHERERVGLPAAGGVALLVGERAPVVAHRRREHLARDLLERVHRLAGAVPGRGAPADLRGAVEVEAGGELRPGRRLHREQLGERDDLPIGSRTEKSRSDSVSARYSGSACR